MTLIQSYQINLNSLSGYIASVATGSGVAGNYYPSNNPSGFIGSNVTGQFYPSSNPNGYISTLSGFTGLTLNNYFGYTGLTITGSGNITGNLGSSQGILTTRINILTGNYTYNFIIGSGNAFAGAINRLNFQFPSSTGINLNVSGYNSLLNINQPGFASATNVYFEFSFDGSKWNLDQWI